jgi:hypothetical protein
MAHPSTAAISAYPPSFEGNPWSYGFALFSLTLICALALAMLLQRLFERRATHAAIKSMGQERLKPLSWANPLTIHRWITTCFLLTILSGAFPDVLVLFAWGEASARTMNVLFLIDRVGDGLTFLPFSVAVGLSAWGRQVVPQSLIRDTNLPVRPPHWKEVKDHIKIVAMVMIIATGVTIAKANLGL